MSNDYIGFIGGGNMTRAIVSGLIESHYPADDLLIAEPAIEQRAVLDRDLPGVVIIEESNADVASARRHPRAVRQTAGDAAKSASASQTPCRKQGL